MSLRLLLQGEDLPPGRLISCFGGTEKSLSVLPAPAVLGCGIFCSRSTLIYKAWEKLALENLIILPLGIIVFIVFRL